MEKIMTRFDQQAELAQQSIVQMCIHMSAAYITTVLDDAELVLVSRHQSDNIVTSRVLQSVSHLSAGLALTVISNARKALLPPPTRKPLVLHSIRETSPNVPSFLLRSARA
jgi:hypothetical protein